MSLEDFSLWEINDSCGFCTYGFIPLGNVIFPNLAKMLIKSGIVSVTSWVLWDVNSETHCRVHFTGT